MFRFIIFKFVKAKQHSKKTLNIGVEFYSFRNMYFVYYYKKIFIIKSEDICFASFFEV